MSGTNVWKTPPRPASLREFARRLNELTDPMRPVRRMWSYCDSLEQDALISGAMPGDFCVVLMFRRTGLVPTLA